MATSLQVLNSFLKLTMRKPDRGVWAQEHGHTHTHTENARVVGQEYCEIVDLGIRNMKRTWNYPHLLLSLSENNNI